MKKILFIAVLLVSSVFTSCTDSSEETLDVLEKEMLFTGGEEQDPDEDPDGDLD